MLNRIILIVVGIALMLPLVGCAQPERVRKDQPVVRPDAQSGGQEMAKGTSVEQQFPVADSLLLGVVAGYNRFGLDLFRELAGGEPKENSFISPTSAAVALSMVYNGAQGGTAEEMARVLGVNNYSLDDVNRSNRKLSGLLNPVDSLLTISSANSLWMAEWLKFKPDFLERTKGYYQAEVAEVNFRDAALAGRMNGWVSEQTHGRIKDMINELDPSTVLYLLNAVYFKGKWIQKFNARMTQDHAFHMIGGTAKQVPLMRQSGKWQYFEGDGLQAIKLPYQDQQMFAGYGRFQMYVFLPDSSADFARFVQSVTQETWQKWVGQFASREGTIMLPRFTVEYSSKLNEPLEQLGMKLAFDPGRADFGAMAEASQAGGNLVLSEVHQKTFLKVDEEGTEAAAATGAAVTVTAVREEPNPFTMVVDHPFVCAIVDEVTTSILFIGAIVNPE